MLESFCLPPLNQASASSRWCYAEEAVRREVFEEAGIRVGAVAVVGSQPWPIGALCCGNGVSNGQQQVLALPCESLHPRRTHLTVAGSQLWSICALRCHHSCQCPGQLPLCRRHPAFSTKAAEKSFATHACRSHCCSCWVVHCLMTVSTHHGVALSRVSSVCRARRLL